MRKTINKIIFLNIPLFLIIGLIYGKVFLINKEVNGFSDINIKYDYIVNNKSSPNQNIKKNQEGIIIDTTQNNISETAIEITPEIPVYKKEIKFSFLGDVMIGGRVKDAIEKNGQSYAFSGTSDYLSEKDAVIFNLETPVTDSGKKFNKKYVFQANKEHLKGLKSFNDNLYANLANNHFGDYGEEGMKNTFKNLNDYGIEYFGAGNNKTEANTIKIIEVEGVKLGLIAQVCIWPEQYIATDIKPGHADFNKKEIVNQIKSGRNKGVDIIVYNMHCGDEYKNGPNAKQINYAHFAIDSGADLVIGHHPHWYQPIEIYKDKIIFYSLGNYIFDIFRGRRTQEGIIVNIIITDKKITGAEIIPVYTEGYGNTVISDSKKASFALKELFEISKKLGNIEGIKEGYIHLNN